MTPPTCWAATTATSNAALIPPNKEYTQSGYDIRHRAVINVDYDLPFGVGRQFVNHPGVLDEIVGGWKTDMQWWAQGGFPFTVGNLQNLGLGGTPTAA